MGQNISKKHVHFYPVGKILLASVIVLHKWGTSQSGPVLPFQHQTRIFWGKKHGVCSLSQNCHQLFFIFSTFLSSCFYVYFSNSDPWISEMKSAPWEPFQLLCILVLFLCPFADVCPQDPWGFHSLWESWEVCPNYTSSVRNWISGSNTFRSLPGNTDEFGWILWILFCRILNHGAGM